MNLSIDDKITDSQYFLFGIVAYWLFWMMCGLVGQFFNLLELVVNPAPVVIVSKFLKVALFFWLFQKPFLWNIKWWHLLVIAAAFGLTYLIQYLLSDFYWNHSYADNRMDHDITMVTMRKVRLYSEILVSTAVGSFLWWYYSSDDGSGSVAGPAGIVRSFYGGMLFSMTFRLLLYAVNDLGSTLWLFTSHYVALSLFIYPLLLLVGGAFIYMLFKKIHPTFSLGFLVALIVASWFCGKFLNTLLLRYHPDLYTIPYDEAGYHFHFFATVTYFCDFAFFIAAFYLYRKEFDGGVDELTES